MTSIILTNSARCDLAEATEWYSLIYAVRDGQVVVVAVKHHARKPGYWR